MFITEQEVNDVHLMVKDVSQARRAVDPTLNITDYEAGYTAAITAINNKLRIRKKETLWTKSESSVLQYLLSRLNRWLKGNVRIWARDNDTFETELWQEEEDEVMGFAESMRSKTGDDLDSMIQRHRLEV